jgi:serine/threonine protein kinase
MLSTTSYHPVPVAGSSADELLARYHALGHTDRLSWTAPYRLVRQLGSGGQGVVYLSERQGTDGFRLPVALKVFSPEPYPDRAGYEEDMVRIAHVAGRVALIQHDNLLDIQDFIEHEGLRVLKMEWIDGYDLRQLLTPQLLDRTRERVELKHWKYLNNVVITAGPAQPRLKPGVAIQVLRDCLAGVAALHREGIVHGDLKPSNVMLKRTGSAKVIDLGSAIPFNGPCGRRIWSPAYAAPEVLEGAEPTPRSDLASLGYVLIEMLSGRSPFDGMTTPRQLIEAKSVLDRHLPDFLPPEVSCNELLLHLCRRLVAPDPCRRFSSAQAADLDRQGAANFHRQLVKGDLASEYANDIRVWLERLN